MQVHYHWETVLPQGSILEALDQVERTRIIAPSRLARVSVLLELLERHFATIDRRITQALDHWSLKRISRIDRAIIRIGCVEILFVEDVPPKVAIREAVRLADRYGGKDSPSFVNGVLDAVYRNARPLGGESVG